MSLLRHRWAIDAVCPGPRRVRDSPARQLDTRDDPDSCPNVRIVTLPASAVLKVSLVRLTAMPEAGSQMRLRSPEPGLTRFCIRPAGRRRALASQESGLTGDYAPSGWSQHGVRVPGAVYKRFRPGQLPAEERFRPVTSPVASRGRALPVAGRRGALPVAGRRGALPVAGRRGALAVAGRRIRPSRLRPAWPSAYTRPRVLEYESSGAMTRGAR
jgi:hypothetical protein